MVGISCAAVNVVTWKCVVFNLVLRECLSHIFVSGCYVVSTSH